MNHGLPDIVESHTGKDGLDVCEGKGQLQALYQDSVPLRKIGLLFSKLIFREIVQLREGKNMHIFTSHPVILRQDKKNGEDLTCISAGISAIVRLSTMVNSSFKAINRFKPEREN